MISRTLVVTIIVFASRALGVRPAIVAELHHRTACSGNPSCSCLNSLLDSRRGLGLEFRVWIQVRLGRALTTMTSPYSLVHIIVYYFHDSVLIVDSPDPTNLSS